MSKPWKSEKYLNWVRSLDCCHCRCPGHLGGTVPHHAIGNGLVKGFGIKSSDAMAIPLCTSCHDAVHKDYNTIDQMREANRTLHKALQDGILILSK